MITETAGSEATDVSRSGDQSRQKEGIEILNQADGQKAGQLKCSPWRIRCADRVFYGARTSQGAGKLVRYLIGMNDAPAPPFPDLKAQADYYRARGDEVRKRAASI